MSARVPLDVDLEDKLLYGLTPMRLAYVAVTLVCGFALWSSHWAAAPVRGLAAGCVIGLGAAAAWGRWQGRPADGWMADITAFALSNYRIEVRLRWGSRHAQRRSDSKSLAAAHVEETLSASV